VDATWQIDSGLVQTTSLCPLPSLTLPLAIMPDLTAVTRLSWGHPGRLLWMHDQAGIGGERWLRTLWEGLQGLRWGVNTGTTNSILPAHRLLIALWTTVFWSCSIKSAGFRTSCYDSAHPLVH